jgi:poly(rC)-binding protein 2/3/4
MARHVPRVEMPVPASSLSKVMGKRGTNLDNIRKVSLYFCLLLE